MIANIASDDALILSHRANPAGLNFRERQVIVLLNTFEPDLPGHLGVYFSIIWLAGFVWTGLYRQSFRCPRCHRYFFRRRLGFADPDARTCLNCNLTCWAPDP
jgi:hypothetical protein